MKNSERFSKVTRRMWLDREFQELSAPPPNAQTLWQRLLTGPELTAIPGLFPAYDVQLARALRWPLKAFREAFREVLSKGWVEVDWDAGLVWVPKAFKHNRPESPNVVKGWRQAYDRLPECDLRDRALDELKTNVFHMGKGFQEAFQKAFPEAFEKAKRKPKAKTSANQEQEQEQEQDLPKEELLKTDQVGAPTEADPDPPSGRRDRLRESLTGTAPGNRLDVQRLHRRFQEAVGLPNHVLTSPHCLDADTLATALDAHGDEHCALVADNAMQDPMVTGKVDERGTHHKTIRYVFGNQDTFARILQGALDRAGKSSKRRSAADVVREQKNL